MFGLQQQNDKAPWWVLHILRRLDRLDQRFGNLERRIMVDFSKVNADVAAETDALTAVAKYVQGQNAALDDANAQIVALKAAIAANDPTAVQAAVDALDANVQANKALAQGILPAITANTTVEPAAAEAAAATAAAPAAG